MYARPLPYGMRHASLFSGIGGFDLAAKWMNWTNVFQVEIDPFCRRVLAHHFPDTERYTDIKGFDGTRYHNQIDIITGGFPCQPFSTASEARKGTADDRFLWPEMLRVIREIRPRFVLGENVEGFIPLGLDTVRGDMEKEGYKVEPHVISAASVGASHRRNRCWILCSLEELPAADNAGERRCEHDKSETEITTVHTPTDIDWFPLRMWDAAPPSGTSFCGVVDGVSDRIHRLSTLGNAIVPQVAYVIFKALELTCRQ